MPDVAEARTSARKHSRAASWTLRVITAAALAVDAFVHADLAGRYDANLGSRSVSQGDLFRFEATASALVALLLLLSGRTIVWLAAWLVAVSAVGALLWYRYHDPGPLGPLPDMYEPLWFREKSLAGAAEAVAVVTATLGLLDHRWRPARSRRQ